MHSRNAGQGVTAAGTCPRLFWLRWTIATGLGVLAGGCAGIPVTFFMQSMLDPLSASLAMMKAAALGPVVLLAPFGAGLGQACLLKGRINPAQWCLLTGLGGLFGTAASNFPLLDSVPSAPDGFTGGVAGTWLWLALNPACFLPLALLQQWLLRPLPGVRFSWLTTLGGAAVAVPASAAALAALGPSMISMMLDSSGPDWALHTAFLIGMTVVFAVSWMVLVLPTGVLLQRAIAQVGPQSRVPAEA
jgi:hypothetical protein